MTLEELTTLIAKELATAARAAALTSRSADEYWTALASSTIKKIGTLTSEHTSQAIADYLERTIYESIQARVASAIPPFRDSDICGYREPDALGHKHLAEHRRARRRANAAAKRPPSRSKRSRKNP